MNFKEMIVPFVLAFGIAWAVQHFILNRWLPSSQTTTERASTFVAPQVEAACKPLNMEVNFIETPNIPEIQRTMIETKWGQLVFSTEGASLEQLTFKRIIDGSEIMLSTIQPVAQTEKEERCFLVAFDQATPFYYTLINRKEDDTKIELEYQAPMNKALVRKTFTIHKNVYKIDLKIVVEGNNIHFTPRILYPAPHTVEGAALPSSTQTRTQQTDIPSSIVVTNTGKFEKTAKSSLGAHQGWYEPTLFGSDSAYFIHAMVADEHHFVERAYYRLGAATQMISILEGPITDKTTAYTVSFYFGPKELDAVAAVDPRLEQSFDYSGIFAPISRMLLAILKWLYSYLGNYGYAIIALTILMKLILFPFTYKSEQGMKQRADMKKKLDYMQQKYKNDPERLAQERAELLQKHGVAGLGGCLPLLLQIPIFIALNNILRSSIELHKAPMWWIPDLSATDPYYLLPLGVCLSMLWQISGGDAQQRMTGIAMALVFGAVATNFSAGLALYIFVSTLLGILQGYVVRTFKLVK
jgi:YidC/Oxa1 family membrane protein insertase